MQGAGGEGYADDVVDERPEEILPYHAHGTSTEPYGFGQRHEVVAHQRYLRHVHRHICATTDGNAHIGEGERLRVVDAVAHHSHALAFALKLLHERLLVAWQHLAAIVAYAHLCSPVASRRLLVATHHVHLDASRLQLRHRLLGVWLQRFALFERYVRRACEVDVRVRNGERARFVDDDRPNLMQVLQRRRVLYENLLLRSLADAHHERRRRSQSHCAGAGYDEHSHSRENSVRQCGVASYSPPHAEREQRDGSHRRHEHPSGSVYDALHGRLAALRLLNHAYDVRKSCVLANLTRTHTQFALTGYGSGEHGVACFLHSRCRFAAYHSLVYIRRISSHETLS